MGTHLVFKLPHVLKPILGFSSHSVARVRFMLAKIGRNLKLVEELMRLPNKFLTLYHLYIMNIIVWNSRGVLKPNFQKHVEELTRIHDPAVFMVMETRLGGERAKGITDRFPFDGAIHTETIGYSGGLWVLWNSNKVEDTQMANTEQEIHVSIKVRGSDFSWIFSAVYASPRLEERTISWNNLATVAESHNLPWVIAGDFNELLNSDDKFGGREISINRSLMFKECLVKCNMIDLGFLGPRFPWSNRREVDALIQERIDRVFVNPEWFSLFPEAKITHLTRCHYDHCPVLLETQPRPSTFLKRPFKFHSFWVSDLSFPNVVANAWRNSALLPMAIENFAKGAATWNRSHFGNIFVKKKKKLMSRLNGMQQALAFRPSAFLVELEKKLLLDLDLALAQEEKLWALKSRVNWMVLGDRNTSFYHLSAIQLSLTDSDRDNLDTEVSDEEIKAALWSLKAFKAPGPDGLHAGFFQRFWLVVGESVKAEVKKVFVEKKVPSYLNKTHIALIPKVQGPETIGNYMPIRLCNTVYKIITKIIVARLRPILGELISPFQTAFVSGRRGTDNAIIVQKLIHMISKKNGRVGYMAIKIDLEKAYDKLEWSFIKDILGKANLPANLIQVIMSSMSTLIQEKCEENIWIPIKASRGGPAFSHLFFTDDLVLFARADYTNCSAIRDVLDEFCAISGQTISESKSKVFFSPNVDRDTKESLSDILGFQSTLTIGKYLGIPIKVPDSLTRDFNFIVDRMKQKLAGWKASLLSQARRAVLVQSSLSTIPNYVMQCTHLPAKVLDSINRVNKNFL
nr:uncharacterized protein LOC111987377 [Quercus suber]